MAHEGNHICLHRFSFIYVTNGLWEDAYTCPINAVNCTTKSAIYVLEVICSYNYKNHLWSVHNQPLTVTLPAGFSMNHNELQFF